MRNPISSYKASMTLFAHDSWEEILKIELSKNFWFQLYFHDNCLGLRRTFHNMPLNGPLSKSIQNLNS